MRIFSHTQTLTLTQTQTHTQTHTKRWWLRTADLFVFYVTVSPPAAIH